MQILNLNSFLILLLSVSLTLTSCTTMDNGYDDSEEISQSTDDEFGEDEFDDGDEPTPKTSTAKQDIEEDTAEELQDNAPEEKVEQQQEEPSVAENSEPEIVEDLTPESAPAAAPSSRVSFEPTNITNIQFFANRQGGAVVIEGDGDLTYTTRMNPETKQFVLELPNANLSKDLTRPYIMKDFQGAFKGINAYQAEGGTVARVVVQLNQAFQPTVQREGSSIVVIPSGVALSRKGKNKFNPYSRPKGKVLKDGSENILGARTLDEYLIGNNQFYGRRISIQLRDADVRDVINFIAEESGANIVMSDDVNGRITLKLRQIPWDQALVVLPIKLKS